MEKIIAISVCFTVATFSSCTAGISYHDNLMIESIVATGADPIAARCAIKGNGTNACAIYIANKR